MSDGPKMPDLGNLMQMAQQMQADAAKMQEELASKTCEASSGGGMVTVTMNGNFELVALNIDKAVADPDDLQMLQDLVVAAVNQAVNKVRDMTQGEMSKLTGGISIPGLKF
ncbi:MAG: YbaB/EbfC family nucleoid-associated protein [Kofleriaceae bacterium]|nr:YbaB/EbfC family nucleoid-associated protein [Kofleriaceae bacterium]